MQSANGRVTFGSACVHSGSMQSYSLTTIGKLKQIKRKKHRKVSADIKKKKISPQMVKLKKGKTGRKKPLQKKTIWHLACANSLV